MSDQLQAETRDAARIAAEKQIDRWPHTQGSIITGFVFGVESVRPNGTIDMTWITGTGALGDDDGLVHHRSVGIVRQIAAELDAMTVKTYVQWNGENGDDDS